jgi:hypothetical protein
MITISRQTLQKLTANFMQLGLEIRQFIPQRAVLKAPFSPSAAPHKNQHPRGV